MMLKRIIYFVYYLKQLNWKLLKKFMANTKEKHGISETRQWSMILKNSLKYNISILEFYQFDFLDKSHEEKLKWAGTGTMYEFQLKANPPKHRNILDDKRLFAKKYTKYIPNKIYAIENLSDKKIQKLLKEKKVVFKDATGKCGSGVQIKKTSELSEGNVIQFMRENQFDMVETYIQQHDTINQLSPSAVNTIRIFTKINDKENYEVLGCRMRISVNCEVDNLAAGNLAAPIDEATGIINGPGIYSDITKTPEVYHPFTGVEITGFQIPYWNEIMVMVKEASLLHPQNKSIGWDVVLTPNGPGLIEGNHDWCKLVWQLPVNKGLKSMLNV
jgi:hypothetical protein